MAKKETNFISSIIYLSKNSCNAAQFIIDLDDVLAKIFNNYEIICVNDGANDELIMAIENIKLSCNCGNFTVVNMGGYHGTEKSMVAGTDLSIGDYVFEFDSVDRDYPLEIIYEMYQKLFQGFDIVSAQALERPIRLTSRFFYYMFNNSSEFDEQLRSESFCIKTRKAINIAEEYGQIIPYRKAVDAACHLKRGCIFYTPIKHKKNVMRDATRLETGIDAIILFTNIAFKISLFFSISMSMVMLGFGIYVIAIYFGSYRQVEGWAPIMGVICLGFLGVFILLTNLFKHIELLLRLQFKKKLYTITSLKKIEGRKNE